MKFYKPLILFIAICFSMVSCRVVKLDSIEILTFEQKLENLFPNAEITKIESKDHFVQDFQLVLNQPLDHKNIAAGTFKHYVYISHHSEKSPTVLVTEGYNAVPHTYELSKILKSNQVQVEYRFYGKSKPDSIPWNFLKNDLAVEDYHQLVTKMKELYTQKWISTGISKGGETVLIYKSKYPYDMDVAVAYVAPLINTQEDERTQNHIETIGTEECRDKIRQFQRLVLEQRVVVLDEIMQYASDNNRFFTELSIDEALEYAVLEFPFSFWQWGGNCNEIPTKNDTSKRFFDYLNSIVGIDFYNDATYLELLPSYYQHWTELGYYGFDITPVIDLLKVVHHPTNVRFAPKNVDLTYNPNYIKEVRDFVENRGNKIIYIYGELDTWSACSPTIKPHVNALKMVLKGGSHKTRIADFPEEDQQLIYDKLQTWLGYNVTIYPLQ